ncbi:Cell wall protein phiA [Paramyrothecium foliicola]|nr:Cell wall protein phiA [Paramyrothecium foliicola]
MAPTTFITALLAAGSAAAAPTTTAYTQPSKAPTKFGIMSLRSASPIHFGQVSAAQSNLFIHLPDQHATCKGKPQNEATFYVKDGELFLYTPPKAPKQKVYVDRSGMGQGNLGYLTGDQGLPRNGETKGWKVENDYISFNGAGLLACPNSIDDAWSIWVSVGNDKPAGLEGCLGFNPRVIPLDKPVKCSYTKQHVDEEVRHLGVGAKLVEELEGAQLRRQADRVHARLLGGLAEELVVPVHAQRLEGGEVAEGQGARAVQGGEVDGDGLEGVAGGLEGHHVVADAVAALLEVRVGVFGLGHDELLDGLGEHEQIREGIVVEVALDQMQGAEGGVVGPLDEVEAAVVQLGPPDDEGLEGGVGEDVDVLLQVPVLVAVGLVEEGAGAQVGEVKGPVEQLADAVQQGVRDGDVEGLEVGHCGDGVGQAVKGQQGAVAARAVDGGVGDELRQLGCGVRQRDALDGGAATRAAAERVAEDEVQLGRQEVHRPVEHHVGERVVVVVEPRHAADVALGALGHRLEDAHQHRVRELRQLVGGCGRSPVAAAAAAVVGIAIAARGCGNGSHLGSRRVGGAALPETRVQRCDMDWTELAWPELDSAWLGARMHV